jgi:hypothetical protein
MTALRALLLGLGLAVLVSTLALDEPEVLRVRGPAAILAFVVGAGALAADAVPLRPLGAGCAAVTMLLALGVLAQLPAQPALGAAMAALQLAPWVPARRGRAGTPEGPIR